MRSGMDAVRRCALAVVAAGALSGCVSTVQALEREGGRAASVAPSEVDVFDVNRGMTNITWKFRVRATGTTWSCTSDDMLERPYCMPDE